MLNTSLSSLVGVLMGYPDQLGPNGKVSTDDQHRDSRASWPIPKASCVAMWWAWCVVRACSCWADRGAQPSADSATEVTPNFCCMCAEKVAQT